MAQTIAAFDPNNPEHSPAVNPDVQEALSRRWSDDIIILLPLKSGNVAVFPSNRELCAIIEPLSGKDTDGVEDTWVDRIKPAWRPPEKNWNTAHVAAKATKPVDKTDLEFL